MVWTEEKLGPIIHSILNPDEEVLSLYQSKTTKSIYGCILWNSYYYKVFRVSNHPSQSTYKQPTFYDFHGEFYMKGAIRTYLYHTNSWYELSKQGYYLLLFFQKLWDEKQEVEASWQNGRMQIRLVVEEEGGQVHYRFPDHQAREVERLLASGMLVAIRSSRNFIKIRTSRFVAPYIALIKQRQLYRKKPSKAMLQWEKYQSQLIEIQRTYRLVEESAPPTFFGHWLNKVQLYLCSAISSYWEEVIKGVEWQEAREIKEQRKIEKLHNPIEDKWKENIARRHKRKVDQLIGHDTLEKLRQLKIELDD
ncbi:TPA: hypothetical protein U1B25_001695 [Streptococcus suis]|nr:hypothetical protein [Streptococcus suis]